MVQKLKPEHEWLGHVQPTGLVVSTLVLDELSLVPQPQDAVDTAQFAEVLDETGGPLLPDAWALLRDVLKWPEAMVSGLPSTDAIPVELFHSLADHETLLEPSYALKGPRGEGWQLLIRVEDRDIEPDKRGALSGWEATPHQRFERLLRETGVGAGILITTFARGELEQAELRLITAPRGETSGWISWPLRSLAGVAGRPMLGGLKLLLGSFTLFNAPEKARLPALLQASRERQAEVSTKLAGQVLAALYELLRGFDAAEGDLVRELAARDPHHLYEGLLTVLMRLVFVLYAEDRDLMPSRREDGGQALYEQGYSVRSLFARLENDAALNPDTMDERRGAWGQLLALFRLIDRGHPSGFMQARGGKLFDEAVFPFLMGKQSADEPDRVPHVSDGCIHRILQSLMIVNGERLSYRTLDVEQIGSVYETVMGFTAQLAPGRSIAIKAGKNNKTPVYVDCEALLATAAKEREKIIKETTGRGQLPAGVKRDLKDADTVQSIEAALAQIADERGSPRGQAVSTGTPILQPTDERRRTGTHYTPRTLTEPIVRHALEPALARLGKDAAPEAVLSLKVCDPACGSGAFLVEATRQIGTRLVHAWEAHKELKPPIPADEDDDLHARRLVAQRCIYGVDRNPMATDLAKLSLWLATLARDHEFSFLDHALKSGDSLVGLTRRQIEGATWEANPQPNLWRLRVQQDVEAALTQREAIRNAPDDVALAMQETRHAQVELGLRRVRLIGDAAVSVFFAHDKDRARRAALPELSLAAGGEAWERLEQYAISLEGSERPTRPFHWEIEFPEVFGRENPGFDAVVGNPPFLGGAKIWAAAGESYPDWLRHLHEEAGGKAVDLAAHFFRRAFNIIRNMGAIGFIATKTIAEGDTRTAGLHYILDHSGEIFCCRTNITWPGEANVIISMVHIAKGIGAVTDKTLNGLSVININEFLDSGSETYVPVPLVENKESSFRGSDVYGDGFIFSATAADEYAGDLDRCMEIITVDETYRHVIRPYIGGKEITTHPSHAPHRYVINFANRTLEEASRWPIALDIVEEKVRPLREKLGGYAVAERRKNFWWQFGTYAAALEKKCASAELVLAISQTTAYILFAIMPSSITFGQKAIVITRQPVFSSLAVLQCRIHEMWALRFGSKQGRTPVYSPVDCYQTFPFPEKYDTATNLAAVGQAYHNHRETLMKVTGKGMTPTYNRFHDTQDKAADVVELRLLHAMMDDAVLRAYGWDDLADRALPGDQAKGITPGEDAARFHTEDDEDDHKYQNRLFWPAPFRDELLARLLKLNEERAAAEKKGN